MKQKWMRTSAIAVALALLAPFSLLAQDDKEKEMKEMKDTKERKETEQVIITRKGDSKEKVVVEIDGDKITVNGKPLEEYKDKDGNVSVMRSKHRGDYQSLFNSFGSSNNAFTYKYDTKGYNVFNGDSNRAMLGVTTEKIDEGLQVQEITKESAAEKAGLKENDIITKVDDKAVESADALSEVIQKHKPGEKVKITYLRDKKEQTATAELSRWKGVNMFGVGKMNFTDVMPKMERMPPMKTPYGQSWSWSGGSGPKLGLSVQDTDDGKGVKVIEVDDESNSEKAGVKNDDVIMEVDGKAVNGADEMAKTIRDSKDKATIMLKIQRAGKTQNIEVKIPKKLKTADL